MINFEDYLGQNILISIVVRLYSAPPPDFALTPSDVAYAVPVTANQLTDRWISVTHVVSLQRLPWLIAGYFWNPLINAYDAISDLCVSLLWLVGEQCLVVKYSCVTPMSCYRPAGGCRRRRDRWRRSRYHDAVCDSCLPSQVSRRLVFTNSLPKPSHRYWDDTDGMHSHSSFIPYYQGYTFVSEDVADVNYYEMKET